MNASVQSRTGAAGANKQTETRFGGSPDGSAWDGICALLRSIFPRKTAPHLAAVTGLNQRTCEYFLSRKTNLSADALMALIRSDHGLKVLEQMMGDAKPVWWSQFKQSIEREILQAQLAEVNKRLAALP